MYEYNGKVINVVDGDTIDVDIDLGFYLHSIQRLRIFGIDTPEIRGPEREEGLKSKAFVHSLLPVGKDVTIITYKKREKYGRFIAQIYVKVNEPSEWDKDLIVSGKIDIGLALLKLGLATKYIEK